MVLIAALAWITGFAISILVPLAKRAAGKYQSEAGGIHFIRISVFYDVQSRESLRLPSADIVVSLEDTTTVPIGCLAAC